MHRDVSTMSGIPRDKGLDSTLALLREGYAFISRRCARYDTDVFETRLMLRPAVCMMGEEAASVFYHPGRFTRRGAIPKTALRLLQDVGSVQWLDGEAHRCRKRMFMSLMTPESISALVAETANQWQARIGAWEKMQRVVLHTEVEAILCRAVCKWAGVPLAPGEARRRTRQLASMIDAAGTVGPANWAAQWRRVQTERWAKQVVEAVRAGTCEVPEESALHVLATHRDVDGELVDADVAAVELLNILRPTVAVAWYVTFAALALHDYPQLRESLRAGGEQYLEHFVQEIRRYYPFFPAVGGRVLEPFTWRGHRFSTGDWVLLDLYGTNHDPRIWTEPHVFRPDRFAEWNGSAYSLVPQGGGEFERDHRCPGERLTIELAKYAARTLATDLEYEMPPQDLGIDLSQMPALPRSRFLIEDVSTVEATGASRAPRSRPSRR